MTIRKNVISSKAKKSNSKDDNEIFYKKMAFVANLIVVISFSITPLYYIYVKFIQRDDLMASVYTAFAPQKSFYKYPTKDTLDNVTISDCYMLTPIFLHNTSRKVIKNIEIDLSSFYSDHSGIPKGCYMKDDTLYSFNKKTKLRIAEMRPQEYTTVYIYSNWGGEDIDNTITTDIGNFKMNRANILLAENEFDKIVTDLVVNYKIIQVLVYILTLLGIYYLVKYIFPFLIKALLNKIR